MREARLVGLSQDGKQLILAVDGTGEEFAVPVDDRLRAALRGDRARLGQLEIQMESALRPRDIQARIRAGESPEAVAAVAQMPMERVMAFAGPVLAERDHVANLAQRASVRRRGGGDAPTRNLGAWVTERLRIRGVDPAAAEWDAWRREDGRWAVRVSYFVAEDDEKVAMFAYDAPGRYAVPDDDEARWLVGEQAQVMPPQQSERRLTAVADIDLSLAPDHGADSYEAGFEDTVNLTRGRQFGRGDQPRDYGRDVDRDFGREPTPRDTGRDWPGHTREVAARDTGRDAGRDGGQGFGREPAARESRDAGRDGAGFGRDGGQGFGRDAGGREFGREGARESFTGRDAERGPRRVHSVPSPDEEPTLIDVPIEPPPALRPAVRAVERPAQPPAEASSMAPPEEQAAAPENRFTERRVSPADPRQPEHQQSGGSQAESPPAEPMVDRRGDTRSDQQADAPAGRRPGVSVGDRAGAPTGSRPGASTGVRADGPAANRGGGPGGTQLGAPVANQPSAPAGGSAGGQGGAVAAGRQGGAPAGQPNRPAPADGRPTAPAGNEFRDPAARSGQPAARSSEPVTRSSEPAARSGESRRPESRPHPNAPANQPSIPNPFDPRRADQRRTEPASGNQPAARGDQSAPGAPADAPARPGTAPESGAAAASAGGAPPAGAPEGEAAAEPKKKPARRGSKRASVPSWDEIMFGKKAD
ncbi:hypothetical protein Kfla_3498 [Kribbella flavida DSM 17836]|uniref:DUF3071 domain-containing protein n=1 Tax=Kribbella flavida (strain DSM 17836 / JCM 10339 / NBRC 14399) TaxID=479435 RepID=D2PLX6_KRIFD|nr:septation protein SepH [Kribbella flavida]ADB32556.1 hypothetical protein Kfla_3498 [Kribbella flavida DSM 17836]